MTDILAWEPDECVEHLFIHFDVHDHFIKLDTFIRTADSARNVVQALDSSFFDSSLEYELIVMPPKSGSFLTELALWVGGSTTAFFSFVNSETGGAFVEGLTGKNPRIWARELGKKIRDRLDKGAEPPEQLQDAEILEPESNPPEAEAKRIAASMLTEITKGILESDNAKLNRVGVTTGPFHEALDARAEFYEACIADKKIKRIGFSREDDFPILRRNFPERAIKSEPQTTPEHQSEWVVSIESVRVTSPQWIADDQKARQWKGRDAAGKDCYFVIEDSEFWKRVHRKELHVDVLDQLKVQWAYQFFDGRPKNRRVLRVIEFNGDKLAEPLAHDVIRAILGDYSEIDPPRSQPTLFDDN